MLRSGCCRSAPWLVIVVKPLYARMHRVVPARKPSHPVSGGVRSAAVNSRPREDTPAARMPAIASTAIPRILSAAVTVAERSTHRLPTRLTRAAATIATTASTATHTSEPCRPKGRSR